MLVRGERKDERVKRGGKKLGQLAAEEAIILEAYHDRFLYKVQFTNSKKNLTVSVKDITSVSRKEEHAKKAEALKAGVYNVVLAL